jgi:hypothetical protein
VSCTQFLVEGDTLTASPTARETVFHRNNVENPLKPVVPPSQDRLMYGTGKRVSLAATGEVPAPAGAVTTPLDTPYELIGQRT